MSVLVDCVLDDVVGIDVGDPIVPELVAVFHALEHAADVESGAVDAQEALEDADEDVRRTEHGVEDVLRLVLEEMRDPVADVQRDVLHVRHGFARNLCQEHFVQHGHHSLVLEPVALSDPGCDAWVREELLAGNGQQADERFVAIA